MTRRRVSEDRVLQIVEASRQRAGRMLSVVDLCAAGTLSVPEIAWLLTQIEDGSGWLVGARPGGAGKTTVMSALLSMLPPGGRVRVAMDDADWRELQPGDCLVAYEIGKGNYPGYVWGNELAAMCALGARGCRIVANLHADTLDEARDQIERINRVPSDHMGAFDLFLPIALEKHWLQGQQRVVPYIERYDGERWQRWEPTEPSARERQIATLIAEMQEQQVVTVADVRRAWLAWLQEHPRTSP